MQGVETNSSRNCCYELYSCISAGCDVITSAVMQVWRVTFGLMIHRMVDVAARKWEWLNKYHRENPDSVEVAVVVIFITVALTIFLCCYCCQSEGEEEEEEGEDEVNPLVPAPLPYGPHLDASLGIPPHLIPAEPPDAQPHLAGAI